MAKEIDSMNLSFIDLLSCGLGGILLLLLLFAALIRNGLSQSREAERAAGGSRDAPQLAEGEELPPPDPLSVRVSWHPEARRPLELVAFPPRAEPGKYLAPDFNGPALREDAGAVRIDYGDGRADYYAGSFSRYRRAGDRRPVVDLLIPNARSGVFDLALAAMGETERKAARADRKRWTELTRPPAARYWAFEVRYPPQLSEKQAALRATLQARWREALDLPFRTVVLSNPAGAGLRGVGEEALPPRAAVPLRTVLDTHQGDLVGHMRAAGGTAADGVPAVVVAENGAAVSVWAAGWEENWENPAARKGVRDLWAVADKLVYRGLAALPRGADIDGDGFHRAALRFYRAVTEKGGGRLSWTNDLNGGRVPGTFADGPRTLADFFRALQEYADQFAGTNADGSDAVAVRVEARTPAGGVPFRHGGQPSATLRDDGRRARFTAPER